MSILVEYQIMTTLAKKVGELMKLAVLTVGGRYLLLKGVKAASKKVEKIAYKNHHYVFI